MVKRLLRNLRQKPKAVRNNIALGIAIVFTGLVSIGWVYTLPMRLSELSDTPETTAHAEAPSFMSFFKNAKEQLASISEVARDQSGSTSENETIAVDAYNVVMPDGNTAGMADDQTWQNAFSTTSRTASAEGESTMLVSTTSSTAEPRSIRIMAVSVATGTATSTQ